jgi:hypothetical protein
MEMVASWKEEKFAPKVQPPWKRNTTVHIALRWCLQPHAYTHINVFTHRPRSRRYHPPVSAAPSRRFQGPPFPALIAGFHRLAL